MLLLVNIPVKSLTTVISVLTSQLQPVDSSELSSSSSSASPNDIRLVAAPIPEDVNLRVEQPALAQVPSVSVTQTYGADVVCDCSWYTKGLLGVT